MEIKSEVEQLIINLTDVSDLFYKQMNAAAYSKLIMVFNEIEKVMNVLGSEDINIVFDVKKINNSLTEAMTAMENQDYILLADIIKYDLIEHFENVKNYI